MHIPVDTPVVFVLTSTDVLHGFYMPVFRIKKDVVPGRYNKIWVQATRTGTFDIFCTQYCGQDHSSMRRQGDRPESRGFREMGERPRRRQFQDRRPTAANIYGTRAAAARCHSVDGAATGKVPTWKDVFGSQVQTLKMERMLADENYLHEVITHPNIHPLPGFQPIMPPTDGLLNGQGHQRISSRILSRSVRTITIGLLPAGERAVDVGRRR